MEVSHKKQAQRWLQVGITCLLGLWLGLGSALPALAEPVAPADDPFHFYAPVVPNNKCMQPPAAGLFGVQYYGDTSSSNAYHSDYVNSGANWIRNSVDWANVEPNNTTPENYKWAEVDKFVGDGGLRLCGDAAHPRRQPGVGLHEMGRAVSTRRPLPSSPSS